MYCRYILKHTPQVTYSDYLCYFGLIQIFRKENSHVLMQLILLLSMHVPYEKKLELQPWPKVLAVK